MPSRSLFPKYLAILGINTDIEGQEDELASSSDTRETEVRAMPERPSMTSKVDACRFSHRTGYPLRLESVLLGIKW